MHINICRNLPPVSCFLHFSRPPQGRACVGFESYSGKRLSEGKNLSFSLQPCNENGKYLGSHSLYQKALNSLSSSTNKQTISKAEDISPFSKPLRTCSLSKLYTFHSVSVGIVAHKDWIDVSLGHLLDEMMWICFIITLNDLRLLSVRKENGILMAKYAVWF